MVVFVRKGPGHRGSQHVWSGWLPWFPFQVPHPLLDPLLKFCQQDSYREACPGNIIGSEDVRWKEESQASVAQCSEPQLSSTGDHWGQVGDTPWDQVGERQLDCLFPDTYSAVTGFQGAGAV